MLRDLNQRTSRPASGDAPLASRMTTFDTAHGLMREAPEAFDLGRGTPTDPGIPTALEGRRPGSFARSVRRRPPPDRTGSAWSKLFDVGSNDELGQPQQYRRPPRAVA